MVTVGDSPESRLFVELSSYGSDLVEARNALEMAIQGFEEYPVVVFKDKGGWKAVLRVGGLDMEIAGGQPTHGIAAGVAHEKMSRAGKKKLDDIVESLLKKGDGPMEMRATSLPPTITIDGKERSTAVLVLPKELAAKHATELLSGESLEVGEGPEGAAMLSVTLEPEACLAVLLGR